MTSLARVADVRDASVVAYRWARTFSRLRLLWSPLEWLAFPFWWLVYLAMICREPWNVVRLDVAAAMAPGAAPPAPRRRLWTGLIGPPVALVGAYRPADSAAPLISRLVAAALITAGLAELAMMVWANKGHGSIKATARTLAEAVAGPVVVWETFGAWPRGTGAGTRLIRELLARTHGVTVLVSARDEGVADWYVNALGGTRVSEQFPLHIAWPRPSAPSGAGR